MKWKNRPASDPEIAPDEIFLDVSNSPEFDRNRFEGKIERPLSPATFTWLTIGLVFIFLIFISRAGYLGVVRGSTYATESTNNSLEANVIFAPRGVITDINGRVLAENFSREDGSMGRRYTMPEMGQIIGYVSHPKKDSNGIYYDTFERGMAGLEMMYNDVLSGKNGKLLIERDAVGKVRSQGTVISPESGKTLVLSIDSDLERKLARAIADVVEEKHFIAGAGVIMDVNTGAISAIVSYPSYDPNIMSEGSPSATIARYNTNLGRPFLDHAVQGAYTPGSVVKPFVASGALSDKLISEYTVIDDKGSISIQDKYNPDRSFIYRGWKALGPVNVRSALAWSSDIFFYIVGGGYEKQNGLGIDRLNYWYRQFGLGSVTGIDLPSEVSGRVTTPDWKLAVFEEPWYLGDTYLTAIGQYSMQVTPIQMARATAAIANGGMLFTPTMLSDSKSTHTNVQVDSNALQIVREGMRKGVTEALAGALNLPYVKVAAKTGTAETGARNQYDNSWVEGFFPYENPKYSFAVVLERGPAGAGSQAVNVMARLFDSLHASGSIYLSGNANTTP